LKLLTKELNPEILGFFYLGEKREEKIIILGVCLLSLVTITSSHLEEVPNVLLLLF
jgi:hypothetical protein